MKIEGGEVPSGAVRSYDICVIGSGAAGITIARELRNSKLTVALLEGGHLEWSEDSQDSYAASTVTSQPSTVLDKDFPSWSRLRHFGGSTNHWGGWCRPLDEVDFQKRSWVPGSGWPITRKDIHDYYKKAADYVQMQSFDLDAETNMPGQNGVATREFHYSPPTRFGDTYRDDLFLAPNIDVILNANVIRFDTTESGQVEQVAIKNAKTDFTVRAKFFVLACGGLENPRLLLNSDHQRREGLGNGTGMVGRCFMEHPHATIGLMVNVEDKAWHLPFTATKDNDPMRIFATTAEFQEKNQLMNFSCQLSERKVVHVDPQDALTFTNFTYSKAQAVSFLNLYTRSEMWPDPNNRVTLAPDRDQLGLRRLNLTVNFGPEDLRSVVQSTEAVIRALSAMGLGRGQISLERDDLWSTDLGPACHHMGTTRMSDHPRDGVVDRNCKVHELKNTFIAGSSVFATGGYANPTLTIVALALRLADHLRVEAGGAA